MYSKNPPQNFVRFVHFLYTFGSQDRATEVEVKERKDRVEDALNATRAAVEEGIVTGGGCALLYASRDLSKVKVKGDDQKAGVDLVKKALEAPIRQITKNAGVDGSVVVVESQY